MKKVLFIGLTCLVITACSTTTKTFPIVYTHSPSTEFEILGTIFIRSTNNVGYNTLFEEAKKQFPLTDFVIDIIIDQHEITTSYHMIAYFFRLLFGTKLKNEQTRYEYTIRGTAIKYIRKTINGEIITTPTPSFESNQVSQTILNTVIESKASTHTYTNDNVTPSEDRNMVTFPQNFIGTWKRDEYDNTLTFNTNNIKSSSTINSMNLTSISDNSYTFIRSNDNSVFTITIIFVNNTIEINGMTGRGQGNWNGTWKKQ